MTREEINQLAEQFFECPTSDRSVVTRTSALLFAEYCAKYSIIPEKEPAEIDRMGGK